MWLWNRRRQDEPGEPPSTVGLIARFTAAGAVVLISLAGLLAFIARQAGTDQAIRVGHHHLLRRAAPDRPEVRAGRQ
jgi:hypothetical protein